MVSTEPRHCVVTVGFKIHRDGLFKERMFVKEALNYIVTVDLQRGGGGGLGERERKEREEREESGQEEKKRGKEQTQKKRQSVNKVNSCKV